MHQIFVKWNHTRLSEDVQSQQRSQEMTMIHRVLIMNIIHVLAHGDTDEIRPSDMDKKNAEYASFQSCLSSLSNV